MVFTKSQNLCCVMIRSARILHGNERLRFLTLTTAPDMKCNLSDAWHILITDIKRLTINRLLRYGYVKENKISYLYGDKDRDAFMKCAYLVIETTEGVSGVYHILMYGDYLPFEWIKARWFVITGSAKSLWITLVDDDLDSVKSMGNYVISQYVSGQSKFKRFSSSRDFTFKGFAGSWSLHKRVRDMSDRNIREMAYLSWNVILKRYLLYGEWALVRNLKVSDMKAYYEKFGSRIVGV